MNQSYLVRLLERRGRILQYARTIELEPGDTTRERTAKTENDWVDFTGFVGQPTLLAGETDPARMYPNRIIVHTVTQLAKDVVVRFDNREYRITNTTGDPGYSVGMTRYEMTANLNVY